MNVLNTYISGIIAPINRKSLPEIAKVVGLKSSQSLHHFLSNSPWSACGLKQIRLNQIRFRAYGGENYSNN